MLKMVLLLLLFANALQAQTYVYLMKTGDKSTTISYRVQDVPAGYALIYQETRDNQTLATAKTLTDKNFNTLVYEYKNNKTDIKATRTADKVKLTGQYNGNTVDKTFTLNQRPWKQCFPADFGDFYKQDSDTLVFWLLGLDVPGAMNMTEFYAKKTARESLILNQNDTIYQAYNLKVSFNSWLTIFWSAQYWIDSNSGVMLKYKGVNRPGEPESVASLVGISP